ncbi:MAG: CHAD domain-containing protein [Pirellulales bacterium]
MSPANKWTSGDSPHQPLTAAARIALEARLSAVRQFLELAAAAETSQVEYVHQLRVWSRRAAAALNAFSTVLPTRRRQWLVHKLQHIRRAAGNARDCDVMLTQLSAKPRRTPDDSADEVCRHVAELRDEAQRPIRRMQRRLSRRLAKRAAKLLDRLKWRGKGRTPTFGAAAREQLAPAVTGFFEAADGDLSDVASLHRFRIAGKRLRYVMELFAAAFPPAFREELYPLVEELQERLGEINDHAAAAARLQAWQTELSTPGAAAALRMWRSERRALGRCRRDFFAWWTAERAAGLQRRFARVLAPDTGSIAG